MINKKWFTTMQVFDEYERRFAKVRAEKEMRRAFTDEVRSDIINETKRILGFKDELIPEIKNAEEISRIDYGSYDVIQLRYTTWESFYGCATLYMPHNAKNVPLVFLLCGHGALGRKSKNYVKMGHTLAARGVAVIAPENIGQGDRIKLGHTFCITPFYCGLTLQGMIVMETAGLIKYMTKYPGIDAKRIGACGNSGGGTLSLFAAALVPEISVLSASGYPSEFSYILSKERRHCACNLLPGIANGPEMWEVLSVFAPKPILLEQGNYDHLIPLDLAHRNARKVENVYVQMDAKENFHFAITEEKHPWNDEDVQVIGRFIMSNLGMTADESFGLDTPEYNADGWSVEIPESSLTAAELAERISGMKMPEDTKLKDIFPPMFDGAKLNPDDIIEDIGRGDVMEVFAQMESTLTGQNR